MGWAWANESKKHQPKNMTELELLLIQEWNKIELTVLEKLVDSVPSRLYECKKWKIIQLNTNSLSYSCYLWK